MASPTGPRLRGGAPLKRYSSAAAAAAAVALSAALTVQLVCVSAQPPPGEPGDGGALGASSGCGAPGDDPAECAALSDFAAALNYKGWKKARAWRTAASICTWHGVTCAGGRVVGLSLGDNNLKGSLPASLGDLSRLATLVLDGQQPPSYSGCSSTDLQYSALPKSFYSLKHLQVFTAEDACLGGTLADGDAGVGALTALTQFSIHQNRVSGPFPFGFNRAPGLQVLKLDRNPISGQVPLFTGWGAALRTFDCNFCALSGPFPAIDFKPLTGLTQMYWDGNAFTSLPASLGDARALAEVSFNINSIRGAFPAGLCALQSLTDCRVGAGTNCSAYSACYPWVVASNASGNLYSCPIPSPCGACDDPKSPLNCSVLAPTPARVDDNPCVMAGEALCTADGACAAFGVFGSQVQLHGCASLVPNNDWSIFVRAANGSYARAPGSVNVNESACASHPNTGQQHSCAPPPPPPPAPPRFPLVNHGAFDAATGESSIVFWNATQGGGGGGGGLVVFESIFCGYWGHAGQWDEAFLGHSYFRVRDFASGVVIANITSSIGFGFGSAFVDYETGTFWVFGTVNDRCGHNTLPDVGAVYAFSSSDPGLQAWSRSKTDVAWTGPNTDVARVLGAAPPGLPPHRYVMITEGATFALNNDASGDLTKGWLTLNKTFGVPDCPEGCQCPSIRFLPSDGHYYILTGGHNIWMLRSADLRTWEQPASRPFIAPSAGDGAVASPAVGNPATIDASDAWYAANGMNTTREMLARLDDWDHNSNDADMCCDSWGGASAVTTSFFNWGPSSQGAKPSGGLNGPSCMQGLATANVTLDKLLQSFYN